MRAEINESLCQGHALCAMYAPNVFDTSDDGYAVVTRDEVPKDEAEAVGRAVAACPERAISLR
jgi:ferredoxin